MAFYRKPLNETVPAAATIIAKAMDLYHNDASSSNSGSVAIRTDDGQMAYVPISNLALTSSNSFIGNQRIVGNLEVIGSIAAEVYNVVTTSVTHYSASTNFGLDVEDVHTFTGSVRITGSLNVTGSTIQIGNNSLVGNTILSGSIDISGSQHFVGNQTISGSVLISGSTTQYGNNTLIGNTTLSGSITISGSVTGSLQIDGDVNLTYPHNFYRWGNRLFNYANYYNTSSVDLISGSVSTLNYTSDIESGFILVSGSQITAQYTGYYNIQYSVQLQKPGAQPADVEIWFSKNGQNIPYTNSVFTLPLKSNLIAALNFFIQLNAGDYVELKSTTNDSTVDAVTIPENGIKPASPAVVVTVSQIS